MLLVRDLQKLSKIVSWEVEKRTRPCLLIGLTTLSQ